VPTLRPGVAALIEDLDRSGQMGPHARPALGQFGRTPRINPGDAATTAGRLQRLLRAAA